MQSRSETWLENLCAISKDGHIRVDELPNLSKLERSILDKSKGDLFTKGLAVVQVLWLMITLVIRWSRHLAITQLEILAVAFAICSTLTYGFCWNKPQDVRTAKIIRGCSHCVDVTQQHYESLSNEMRKIQTDSIVKELVTPLSRLYICPYQQ